MDRRKQDRRIGPDRRGFEYSKHIPELRSGICSGNGRRIPWGNRRTGMTNRRIRSFFPHNPERRECANG